MHRVLRWSYYSRRQRELALGAFIGSSAVLGFGALKTRRPVQADSGSFRESSPLRPSSTAISHNASLSDRAKQSSGPTPKRGNATDALQLPPPQTKGHATFETKDDSPEEATSGWQSATNRVAAVRDSFTGWDFGTLRVKVTSVLPPWIRTLPGYMDKLNNELSGAPWSLSWEIWEDAHDPEINPEIIWDADVRISKDLCPAEQAFLRARHKHTTKALAKYLGVPESEINPEDVPTIGLCGSGGGLRALVAGASSSLCAQEAGLFDCVTYTAGVSGSCWLQTLYNSSIGRQNYQNIIDHLKQRIGVHIAYPPAALSLLATAPTSKFLLSGFVEKLRGVPEADFGVVDVYGLLLAARLLVPKGELRVSDDDLKISKQSVYVAKGAAPLPIYTAVRHEIPSNMKADIVPSKHAWRNTEAHDWFQWFEWTPYEFFCEELECGIPTWAVGRSWDSGRTLWRENGLALPELRTPLMMGIWGSAFCATLSHYYTEVKPMLMAAGLSKLDVLLQGKQEDLVKVHPLDPAVVPNFAKGLRHRLPEDCPESLNEASHLQLMDAGMSNNLPIYPLLRPGRDLDVIIAFDASADVRSDNWVKVVDSYARQRGIRGWPMGAGWPPLANDEQKTVAELGETQQASAGQMNNVLESTRHAAEQREDLGYCNIWVGSTEEKQEDSSDPVPRRVKFEDGHEHLVSPDAGLTLIYFPFLANDKVPGVDPLTSDFMSTWNFVYTPEEVDKVVALARANFDEGREQTRRTIRAVWERKKKLRLQREEEERHTQQRYRLRSYHEDGSRGDHFSGN